MNKINVLFDNAQYKNLISDTDYNENYEFVSDAELSGLLRNASVSISNIDHSSTSQISSRNSTNVPKRIFSPHPKRITEESLISLDSCEDLLSYDNLMKTFSDPNKFTSITEPLVEKNIEEKRILKSNIPVKTHVKFNDNIEMKNQFVPRKAESECLTSDNTIQYFDNDKYTEKIVKSESETDTGKETVVCKKINSMLLKINSLLHEIRLLFQSGIVPVESPDDQMKREKRSFEFSTRVSRNYLYQISRQIVDLNKNLRPGSSKNSSYHLTLNQKFVNAHQVVIQALQAFCSYIPQSIVSCIQNKFQESLTQILELCKLTKNFRVFYNIHSHYAVIEEVEKTCESLMEFFEKQTINEEIDNPVEEKISVEKKNTKKPIKKKPVKHRLAMYSTPFKSFSKGNVWEKNVEMLAKQRFNYQSRYKPGVYNPKPRDKPVVHFLDKNVTAKNSSEIKSTSTHSCINDNDIPTMVQMENDSQVSVDNTETALAKTETEVKMKLEPLLEKLFNEMSTSKDEFMDQTNCNNVLDKLKGLLDQVQCLKATPQTTRNDQDISDKKCGTNNTVIKPKSNVTVTGEKNAQLICIKDKSCYDNHDDDTEGNKNKNKDDGIKKNIEKSIEKTKVVEKNTFGMLPKKFAINIVQYKLDFHKFTKSNHMYKKTLLIQPWLLTSKLSDKLLEKLLYDVTSEIELNEIVNKVYNAEFE